MYKRLISPLLMCCLLIACGGGGGGGDLPDTAPPTVANTSQANGATAVAVNSAISATFSEAVASGSITNANFTVTSPAGPVTGTISVNGSTATFTPSAPLAPATLYTVRLSGATDAAGNALAAAYTWTFTTGAAPPDTTPPAVSSASPVNAATGVAVNSAISATFSEVMLPSTVTSATFTLSGGVTGTVAYSGTMATFTPSGNLAFSTTYTATISAGAKDAAGNALAAPYTWTFTTGAAPDTTPPTVSSTSPTNAATGVAVNSAISVTFSEVMLPSTITNATFTLSGGVTGTVAYSGTTATFTPSGNLAFSTTYTATISAGAKDAAGNALAAPYTWTFTTGAVPDTTPPTVSTTSPANAATSVAVNSAISATFSEVMLQSTITSATFTLSGGVTGTVAYSGTTATFTPSGNLAFSTTYTATITLGVKDAAGNALAAPYTWTFTTGAAPDTTPPTVSTTSPASAATGVGVNSAIRATFSEVMLQSTITSATFTLSGGVTGTVAHSGTTATFTPSSNLAFSTTYTATISVGAKDAAGNPLAAAYTWAFTSAAGPAGSNTLSGTVAAGEPIVGTVTIKDSSRPSKERFVTIAAAGKYAIDISGLTAPFMLRADGAIRGRSYSIYSGATQADVGGTINITPLTDLIVANVAGQIAVNFYQAGNFSILTSASLNAAEALLQARLQPVLAALGVNRIDLLRTPFSANGTGIDAALGILRVTVDATTTKATITNDINDQQIIDDLAIQSDATTLTDTAGIAPGLATLQGGCDVLAYQLLKRLNPGGSFSYYSPLELICPNSLPSTRIDYEPGVDGRSRMAKLTNALTGYVSSFSYDLRNQLTAVVTRDSAGTLLATTIFDDASGLWRQVSKQTNARTGNVTSFLFSSSTYLLETVVTHDSGGTLLVTTTFQRGFDGSERVATQTNARTGNVTSFGYEPFGQLATVVTRDSAGSLLVTATFERDAPAARIVQQTNARTGDVTSTSYNNTTQLPTQLTHDSAGTLLVTTTFDRGPDGLARVRTVNDHQTGRISSYVYDSNNRAVVSMN